MKDAEDLGFASPPNCTECLQPMLATVGAWWCARCEVAVRPGDE